MPKSVVWKFEVPPAEDGRFEIPLPRYSKPLNFGYDGRGVLCLWAEIPDASQTKTMPKYRFRVVVTGEEFEPEGEYMQTLIQPAAFGIFTALVFHIYKVFPL